MLNRQLYTKNTLKELVLGKFCLVCYPDFFIQAVASTLPSQILVPLWSPNLSAQCYFQVLQCVGDHLARHINLEFSKETVIEMGVEKSPSIQEPWRELYL